jgi:hypothetical protein
MQVLDIQFKILTHTRQSAVHLPKYTANILTQYQTIQDEGKDKFVPVFN